MRVASLTVLAICLGCSSPPPTGYVHPADASLDATRDAAPRLPVEGAAVVCESAYPVCECRVGYCGVALCGYSTAPDGWHVRPRCDRDGRPVCDDGAPTCYR